MHITAIEASFPNADTFFPQFDESEWDIKPQDKIICPDTKVTYQNTLYLRKNNQD